MNAKKFLESETKNSTESHAYLFIGGEREAEELITYIRKARNILDVDVTVVRPEAKEGKAGEIKVEDTRRLLKEISRSPEGKMRLAVIYSCDRLSASSGNVLLKSLEEPAGPTVFILVADSPAVLSTIKSRCRILNLSRAGVEGAPEEHVYIPELKKGFYKASSMIDGIVKAGETDKFICELSSDQRKKLLDSKNVTFAKNLEEIEAAKKKISQNGNQRLILECLILKIGDDL